MHTQPLAERLTGASLRDTWAATQAKALRFRPSADIYAHVSDRRKQEVGRIMSGLVAGSSYAIAISSAPIASAASRTLATSASATYCGWKTFTLYLVSGIVDWLGGKFCWNGSTVWITDGPHTSCYPFLPGAGCFYQSAWVDRYGYYIQINGDYFQNCVWGFPCNHYLWLGVWAFDGGQDNGTNGF